jgi:hypothetical protein
LPAADCRKPIRSRHGCGSPRTCGEFVPSLGVRALWRHWDLLDRLAGEHDAYVIPQVLAHATRAATPARRHGLASMIRSSLRKAELAREARVVAVAEELEALASELDEKKIESAVDQAIATLN